MRRRYLSYWISPSSRSRSASGSAMIEFAAALPVIALLLFGIVQYGLIFTAQMTVRNAAVMAARYATVGSWNSASVSAVESVARSSVVPFLDPARVHATAVQNVTVGGTAVTDATRITVYYDVPLFFRVPGLGSGTTFRVSAVALMR